MPPDKGMELSVKSNTSFAKRIANGAPPLPAGHPRRMPHMTTTFAAIVVALMIGIQVCSAQSALVVDIEPPKRKKS